MIAQLSNIQQFFAQHMTDVLDWGRHVRPDPEHKTTGDAAYVTIDSGLNRYKLSCLSSYVDPPSGAPYQCKALGTVTFDDFAGSKHIIAPKSDATWAEISKHIHVRELTDGLAIARRELAEASPETVGAVRVRVAELVARAQKWGVEAKGLPALSEVPKTIVAPSQWTPEELAELAKPNAPPVFTVRDERASAATTVSTDKPLQFGDSYRRPDGTVDVFMGPVPIDKPFLGCPILFITNPGESITGMTEIPGWCVNVHSDETISAFVTPDHSEPMYRDKMHRRNPAKNIRSNCWDFNEQLMAPYRMAAEVERLAERVAELEKAAPDMTRLAEMQKQAHEIKAQANHDAATQPGKRRPGRPSNAEKEAMAVKAADRPKDEEAA